MLAAQCDRQNMMDPVCCCPQAARRGTHESASSACRVRFTASSNPLLPRSRRRSHGRAIWLRTWSSAESSYRADVIPRVPSFVLRAVDTLPLLAGGLALLGGAGVFGQDQSLYLQGLLGIEVTFIVVHGWPLLPLATPEESRQADAQFMATFTRPAFFSSEVIMYWVLATTTPLRDSIPLAAFGIHAAFHVAYTILSAAAPQWCVDANTQRVSKGAASLPLRLWNGALNALNAADMGMHVLYAAALAAAIAEPGPAAATAAVAAAGSLAALAALRAAGGGAVRTPTADAVRAASAGASAGLGGARDVRGHTVVVTGASSGIGFEVARQLQERGANVLLLCRDDATVEATTRELQQRVAGSPGAGTAEGVACDLSSLASVRAAAESVLAEHEAVDALVLCAGAALWGSAGPPRLTADGIEAHVAVNHLSHAELVAALTPALAASRALRGRPARVVLVGSTAAWWTPHSELERCLEAHAAGAEAAGALAAEQHAPWAFYSISKRAQALYTRALGARLGGDATAVAVHPGVAASGLQRHMGALGTALQGALLVVGFTPDRAASRVVEAVLSEAEPPQGAFLVDGKPTQGARAWGFTAETDGDAAAERVWRCTELLRQRALTEAGNLSKNHPRGRR